MKRRSFPFAWIMLMIAIIYMVIPLYATFEFSLHAKKNTLTLIAYTNVLSSPAFANAFFFSLRTALITIIISLVLIMPTAYWVRLKFVWLRPVLEFFTLLPFVIPPVVLAFGLIKSFNGTILTSGSNGVYVILLGAYLMLSLPYMYRSIDTGLQSMNVRVLTEAAQSLGCGWFTIMYRVIFPNLIVSILSGTFVTFAIVMGEFTIANLLAQPAFGPYMYNLSSNKVYEPSAVAIISFALTWLSIALIGVLGNQQNKRRNLVVR